MRISKVFQLQVAGKNEVTIKEVSPYGVYQALQAEDKISAITALVEDSIDLTRDELKGLYGSEIEQLVDGFMEVNKSFLVVIDKLGLKQTMVELSNKALNSVPLLAAEMLNNLQPVFSTLFKEAMAQVPGIMDGAALSSLLKPSQQ